MTVSEDTRSSEDRDSAWQVFLIFLRLGLTSFGGPVAHLGFFRDEFVARRKWFSEQSYADLVALSQFLPGPASSQVGLAIGYLRAGLAGAAAAWTAFTLPSAIALVVFALGLAHLDMAAAGPWLQGLKIAAVAVVAKAVLDMARTLAPDMPRAGLAATGALAVILLPALLGVPTSAAQICVILAGGLIGFSALRAAQTGTGARAESAPSKKGPAVAALVAFFALLIVLPVLAAQAGLHAIDLFDAFYRSGALVFGGGHVVLPLLQAEVVQPGWVDTDDFLAGYGAAQAVPGPLFTFAAYLGAVNGGWLTAALCLIAIYVPSFLLVFGALPFWDLLRRKSWAQSALAGINAAVVGLLLAALYDPVWTSGILRPSDFAIAAVAFLALHIWKTPPWLIVPTCALSAGGLHWLAPAAIWL